MSRQEFSCHNGNAKTVVGADPTSWEAWRLLYQANENWLDVEIEVGEAVVERRCDVVLLDQDGLDAEDLEKSRDRFVGIPFRR